MGYVYLGQSRIASIFKELPVETLIDTLCDKVSIEELDIPDGVSSVGDYLFYNCPNLTKVIIPASVKNIGKEAFYNSNKIEVIEFNGPPPLEVGETAFPATDGIYRKEFQEEWEAVIDFTNNLWNNLTMEMDPLYTVVKYSDGSTSSFLIEGKIKGSSYSSPTTQIDNAKNAKEIRIGKAVTSIGQYAFGGCKSLISLTIPPSVTSIDKEAFCYCENLKITVDSANTVYASLDGALFNKSMTKLLRGPGATSTYTIPSSVTSIGDYAFEECASLTSVTILEGVTSIGDRAFLYCDGLTSVTIPEGVTSIGTSVFYGCDNLTSVTIPSTMTIIGNNAFYWCYRLTSITIPSSVTSIGYAAFEGCSGLTSITFEGKTQSQVKAMSTYDWGLTSGKIIICTDGNITTT